MKKTIAIILTLALMLAVAPATVFALDTGAGIIINPATGPEIVDPDDPIDDDDDIKDKLGITSMAIDFGTQVRSLKQETYDSRTQSASTENQYLGLAIMNVEPTENGTWKVNAKIAGFKTTTGNSEAIYNFTIDMYPKTLPAGATSVALANPFHPTIAAPSAALIVGTAHKTSLTPGKTGTIWNGEFGESSDVFINGGPGVGFIGSDFYGVLKVPGGAVQEAGASSAIIQWTLTYPL